MDNMGDGVHVQATGRHVGGHQQPDRLPAELAHDMVALGLAEVSVQGISLAPLLDQGFRHGLGILAGSAEHQTENTWRRINNALEPLVAVALVHQETGMGDIGGHALASAHRHLARVVEVIAGNGCNTRWHGG